ncbi:uncharacterized protein MONOS_11920 [Monocercomonoides exilis]|uniref:uncharacterized protein n=1 Tax=Monocercomonoides exilis TaxID=2049356 RepID=UPI0035599ECA|nr:hypothetical protein MONOS_11920 [Monocercomonoides exilis]|eukprot:MONOS_11920.1-p1 / transcript=MONOS_11920.1 / gene=MONOS_11920 / organism=Monocercomonoides_exilis_PA203 / gene_product=unspecified product / transcript_product=unspecified product / location=Mono_scaffold00625:28056-28331(-) / protein_length=92 / sequence_SO=supercontig / SO=protein_coding / is_pseudo=false
MISSFQAQSHSTPELDSSFYFDSSPSSQLIPLVSASLYILTTLLTAAESTRAVATTLTLIFMDNPVGFIHFFVFAEQLLGMGKEKKKEESE